MWMLIFVYTKEPGIIYPPHAFVKNPEPKHTNHI